MIAERQTLYARHYRGHSSVASRQFTIATRRNKFLFMRAKNLTTQIQATKEPAQMINRSEVLGGNSRKSSYQLYRENQKKSLKQKWRCIQSERNEKFSQTESNPEKGFRTTMKSFAIHSRHAARNSYHTRATSFSYTDSNEYFQNKFNGIQDLISRNRTIQTPPALISLSLEKQIFVKFPPKEEIRSVAKKSNGKYTRFRKHEKTDKNQQCRPWSGVKYQAQVLISDITLQDFRL